MGKIQVIGQVLEFANKSTEIVRVLKAFLVGYDAFIRELNGKKDESE